MENEKKNPFWCKNQLFPHCIIKWPRSVKMLAELESTHEELSYEELHDIVPSISKFHLEVKDFRNER
jgi:hypothetical protein